LYDISIATGTNARTLQLEVDSVASSSILSIRKRSRSRIEPSEVPVIKKKKDLEEDQLVLAINRSIESRLLTLKSNIMKAIEILSEEYYERLTEDDFSRATDTLSDDIKASVFISLSRKDTRDKWLERHASIILI
jgi:hypothetical protein